MFREGLLVVLSGPSGAGKGTVLKLLREVDANIKLSVSATTRYPREGEVDGQNYFFKSVDEFKDMIENDELVEWVEYCGNYYGTPKKHIKDSIVSGFDIILEIEVEGAANIKSRYPDCVSIFVLPPSFAELEKRIKGRGTEKDEDIFRRLGKAKKELTCADKYDYIVINDKAEDAAAQIRSIIQVEKLKAVRNGEIIKQICSD